MLNDDLLELYYLVREEATLKEELKSLKETISNIKENMEEIKLKIIKGLSDIDHKYAKYKNMDVTLMIKPEKTKIPKDQLSEVIEQILDMKIDTPDKRDKILMALKPKESGTYVNVLNVKIKKLKRDEDNDYEEDKSDE